MNGKIPSPFMTFNVSNAIAKTHNKSGKTRLSHGLVLLNEIFDKWNKFGTPSNIQNSVKFTFKRHSDNFKIMQYLLANHSINSQRFVQSQNA